MSKVTDENFIGWDSTVVGYVRRGPGVPPFDRGNERGLLQITIPVDERYKKGDEWVTRGTTWVQYTALASYLQGVSLGDKVKITNAQTGTPFISDSGNKSVDLSYGKVTVLEHAVSEPDTSSEEAPF